MGLTFFTPFLFVTFGCRSSFAIAILGKGSFWWLGGSFVRVIFFFTAGMPACFVYTWLFTLDDREEQVGMRSGYRRISTTSLKAVIVVRGHWTAKMPNKEETVGKKEVVGKIQAYLFQ